MLSREGKRMCSRGMMLRQSPQEKNHDDCRIKFQKKVVSGYRPGQEKQAPWACCFQKQEAATGVAE